MKITREQLRAIVGEVLQEEKDYQSFFKAMLKKHGVASPDEFKSDDEKKAFFNKVEDNWKGVSERLKSIREAELTDKQKQLDIDGDGKIEGDDLAKLRAGAKPEVKEEEEESTSLTKILSKEGETLVKSGAGKLYNITKVKEELVGGQKKLDIDKDGDIGADDLADLRAGKTVNETTKKDIEKLTSYKDLDKFFKANKNKLNKKYVPQLEDEIGGLKYLESDYKRGDADREEVLVAVEEIQDLLLKSLSVKERVNEGKYDADLDKVEAAVKGASSFMGVGAELKKAGIKYTFVTEMIPMYMIPVPGNTIAICNKKYAAGADREVKDIAIGLLK